jgi:hypothetical protein
LAKLSFRRPLVTNIQTASARTATTPNAIASVRWLGIRVRSLAARASTVAAVGRSVSVIVAMLIPLA